MFLHILLITLLLTGCSQTLRNQPAVDPPPNPTILVPVETLRLGQTTDEVRSVFGDPEKTETTTTLRTSLTWVYEEQGFRVLFVDNKLMTVAQWTGHLSNGLAIGDSRQRVIDRGIPIEPENSSTEAGFIEWGDAAVIEVQIEDGIVKKFYYRPSDGV